MTITTLKSAPHLFSATVKLIETAFEYKSEHHFDIDFAPLVDESNIHNCFIITNDDGSVCAHVGVCEREINGIKVALLGGIAVDEAHRGSGKFQELMMEVMSEKKSDVAFFVLWSDKEKLYKKFGFQLCGSQYQSHSSGNSSLTFEKTKYSLLSDKDKNAIKFLYNTSFAKSFTTAVRSGLDWEIIFNISSSDLYIERNDSEIYSYYFQNKGQDLKDIIFEYGSKRDLKEFLSEISKIGTLWSPEQITEQDEEHYQFMLAPGNTRLFSQLVERYTDSKILIKEVNSVKQEVFFQFQEDVLVLSSEEFLRGVFGPQPFEELGEIRPLFFSGLDSI